MKGKLGTAIRSNITVRIQPGIANGPKIMSQTKLNICVGVGEGEGEGEAEGDGEGELKGKGEADIDVISTIACYILPIDCLLVALDVHMLGHDGCPGPISIMLEHM